MQYQTIAKLCYQICSKFTFGIFGSFVFYLLSRVQFLSYQSLEIMKMCLYLFSWPFGCMENLFRNFWRSPLKVYFIEDLFKIAQCRSSHPKELLEVIYGSPSRLWRALEISNLNAFRNGLDDFQNLLRAYSKTIKSLFKGHRGPIHDLLRAYSSSIEALYKICLRSIEGLFKIYFVPIHDLLRAHSWFIESLFKFYLGSLQNLFEAYV